MATNGTEQQPVVCETNHEDVVHDTQWDFYGRFMATCSSDRTVRIFAASSNQQEKPRQVATLTGHEGPVWMVNWAHPKFGNAVASCSYDHRAIVWKEGTNGMWKPVHIIAQHKGSVNALSFSPNEYGLNLATASSDGTVAVTSFADGNWRESITIGNGDRAAHPLGAMSVSFAPFHPTRTPQPMLASGGCDAAVRVWSQGANGWTETVSFNDHKDWVRDVAYNPDASSKYTVLASCSQDKTVVIRRIDLEQAGEAGVQDAKNWEVSVTSFPETCWRMSWSPCGTMLLVTTGDSQAFLLKQGASFTDEWIRMPIEQ